MKKISVALYRGQSEDVCVYFEADEVEKSTSLPLPSLNQRSMWGIKNRMVVLI